MMDKAALPQPAHTPATVVVVDDDPAILTATGRALRNVGYAAHEASSGREAEALVRDLRPDLVLCDVDLGDADGRTLCQTLRQDPALTDTFFVLISASVQDSDDQARGLEMGADGYILRPIGNRELLARVQAYLRIRDAERRRRHAERAAYQAQRLSALGLLAGGAGHEISNPLMGIMGYAEILMSETPPDGPVHTMASEILHESQRIAAVLKAMRSLSRSTQQTEARLFDLAQLVNAVSLLLKTPFHNERQIALHVLLPEAQPMAYGDAAEINYVLVTLLTYARNALDRRALSRHEPKNIRITLDTETVQDRVRLTVEDNSDGLAQEAVDRLFDPFFTVWNRTEDNGLSLAIAHRIVLGQGGELTVESLEGAFTRFRLDLPNAPPASPREG